VSYNSRVLVQTTHATLLARLGSSEDPLAWREFCSRYGDLIREFARRQSLQPADCDDVLQDVLMALTKAMPGFDYDPARGKFRSYLKTVTLRAIFAKRRQKVNQVPLLECGGRESTGDADPPCNDSDFDEQWDAEWRQYHLRQAMDVIRAEFNEADLRAFQLYAVEGQSAAESAKSLNMSLDQVYQAKSRILRRLSAVIEQQVLEEG
jgi:RNA polymerase sigma-70 factor, ECF subfamily